MVLPVAVVVLCGCHSLNKPASASFASVVIPSKSVDEIRRATAAVFAEAGYEAFVSGAGDLVFEKEGTRMNQIAHGGWLEDSGVRERVRIQIVNLFDGSQRLQCKAYMVRHSGDAFYQDEVKLANFRSGPYQDLLDKVASGLK
jgi:hypothetical protein